jgi:hypothetical protein
VTHLDLLFCVVLVCVLPA